MKFCRALGVGLWVLGVAASPLAAQDMPDPSQIHGRALPAPELRDGTVTVRVVREAIGNDVPGQTVALTVGNATQEGITDAQGRAEFSRLAAGEATATVTVDGETLASLPFMVPTRGGVRVILVAGMARAAARKALEEQQAAAAPAVKGEVVLGSNSRVILEFNNDALTAFYILEIVNTARARVDVGAPLIIELPPGAADSAAMDGSSPQATVDGRRITITGPFASGTTSVQVAYRLLHSSSTLTLTQTWPVPLQRVTVGVEKIGGLQIASPQFATTGDVAAESGTLYVVGTGGALQANAPLTVTLSNLPVRSHTSRYVALGLALLIAIAGGWLAWRPGRTGAHARQALVDRRDSLLGELAKLEARSASAAPATERQSRRRRQLMTELEQLYGELDESGA
jgi:hypothetical protein